MNKPRILLWIWGLFVYFFSLFFNENCCASVYGNGAVFENGFSACRVNDTSSLKNLVTESSIIVAPEVCYRGILEIISSSSDKFVA